MALLITLMTTTKWFCLGTYPLRIGIWFLSSHGVVGSLSSNLFALTASLTGANSSLANMNAAQEDRLIYKTSQAYLIW